MMTRPPLAAEFGGPTIPVRVVELLLVTTGESRPWLRQQWSRHDMIRYLLLHSRLSLEPNIRNQNCAVLVPCVMKAWPKH